MTISGGISGCKLHIAAVQSVIPTKPTDPRQSKKLHIPQDHLSSTLFQRCFNILLCYDKASEEDSGWLLVGRIKDTLGRALQEYPLLAGRLRRCQESEVDFEIVSNDSGVRLIESRVEMKLADFVELKENSGEGDLVFWEDVLPHNPQHCPLFYLQVTNFACGGYSVGISCSLLLVDPFVLSTFLKKWTNLHSIMVAETEMTKIPTFYLPKLGNLGITNNNPNLLMGPNADKNAAETLILKIPSNTTLSLDNNINVAELCIKEVERKVGRKITASSFSIFKILSHGDAKVEICARQELLESTMNGVKMTCRRTWDELGFDDVCFNKGKKPVYASCWINSVVDEGSVMIIPSSSDDDDDDDDDMKVLVTFN